MPPGCLCLSEAIVSFILSRIGKRLCPNVSIFNVSVSEWESSTCVWTSARGGQRWASDLGWLELQAVVSQLTWVLGTHITSSGSVARALTLSSLSNLLDPCSCCFSTLIVCFYPNVETPESSTVYLTCISPSLVLFHFCWLLGILHGLLSQRIYEIISFVKFKTTHFAAVPMCLINLSSESVSQGWHVLMTYYTRDVYNTPHPWYWWPAPFMCWILNSQENGIKKWVLWQVIVVSLFLLSGINVFVKEISVRNFVSFTTWGDSHRWHLQAWTRRSFPEARDKSINVLILNFLPCRTVELNICGFSHSVCSSLL